MNEDKDLFYARSILATVHLQMLVHLSSCTETQSRSNGGVWDYWEQVDIISSSALPLKNNDDKRINREVMEK
jgi:hypothetical protein